MLDFLILFSVGYILYKGKGKEKLLAIIPVVFYFTLVMILGAIAAIIDPELSNHFGVNIGIGIVVAVTTLYLAYKLMNIVEARRIDRVLKELNSDEESKSDENTFIKSSTTKGNQKS